MDEAMATGSRILPRLRQLGLNQYEAQTYLALASSGAASAGDLAEVAEIPRPRIYDVLARLEKKGFVALQPGRPVKYVAAPFTEAIQTLRKHKQSEFTLELAQMEKLAEEIGGHMGSLSGTRADAIEESVWILRGRNSIQSKTASMIDSAKSKLILATTATGIQRKLEAHGESLANANKRGVAVHVVLPKNAKAFMEKLQNYATVKHADPDTRFLIKDGREALVFLTPDNASARDEVGLWVHNPAFATTLEKLHR